MEDLRPNINKNIIIIGAGGILLLLVAITFIVSRFPQGGTPQTPEQTQQEQTESNTQPSSGSNFQGNPQENQKSPPPAPGVIATVGEEYIYQSDLDDLLSSYPPTLRTSEEGKKAALQFLTEESITLQAGAKEEIINLSPSFYNSSSKDRTLRAQQAERVRTVLESNTGKISGSVFSIWFFNNNQAGSAGYEEGKKIAFQKITQYRQQMISERLSPDELAARIKADTDLAKLDFVYKQNAIYTFENVGQDDEITIDEGFDKEIRKLKVNQVGNIYLAKAPYQGAERDALYMFAYVTKNETSDVPYRSVEEWLQLQKKNYAVTTF